MIKVIKHSTGTTIDIGMTERWYFRAYRFVFNAKVYPKLRWMGLSPGKMLIYRAFVLRFGSTQVCIGQKP
jgi:hypothetical protein